MSTESDAAIAGPGLDPDAGIGGGQPVESVGETGQTRAIVNNAQLPVRVVLGPHGFDAGEEVGFRCFIDRKQN